MAAGRGRVSYAQWFPVAAALTETPKAMWKVDGTAPLLFPSFTQLFSAHLLSGIDTVLRLPRHHGLQKGLTEMTKHHVILGKGV